MKTIGDMRNEMYFYDYYNVFEYNQDYVKFYEIQIHLYV